MKGYIMIHESQEHMNSFKTSQTRRGFFKTMAFLGLVTFVAPKAHAKGSKTQFKYQDTPKNGETCKECMFFEPDTNTCKIVEGNISPEGWCTLYRQDPNK